MKIKTINNKGIHLICSDGVKFSIQFGCGNYCQNYHDDFDQSKPNKESGDCEMAVIGADGKWITKEFFPKNDDEVVGYVKIYDAINMAMNYEKSLKT